MKGASAPLHLPCQLQHPADSPESCPPLSSAAKEGARMESLESLRERVEALEHRAYLTERRLRWWRALTCGAVVLSLYSVPLLSGTAQEEIAAKSSKGVADRVATL